MENKLAMTIDDVVDSTGIGKNTLRLLVINRKLPVLHVGRKHLVRTDALTEFLRINEGVNLRDIDNVKAVK